MIQMRTWQTLDDAEYNQRQMVFDLQCTVEEKNAIFDRTIAYKYRELRSKDKLVQGLRNEIFRLWDETDRLGELNRKVQQTNLATSQASSTSQRPVPRKPGLKKRSPVIEGEE
jgi:hypothetical protein